MTTVKKTVCRYVAFDGKEFTTKDACEKHEAELRNQNRLNLKRNGEKHNELMSLISSFKHPHWDGKWRCGKFIEAEVELAAAKLAIKQEWRIRRPNKQKLRVVAPLLMRLLNARNNLADLKTRYKEARAALEKNRQERNQLIQEINKEG